MIMYDACQTFCYIGMAGCFVGLCWNGFLMSFLTACSTEGNVYELDNGWMKDTCNKVASQTCPKLFYDPISDELVWNSTEAEELDIPCKVIFTHCLIMVNDIKNEMHSAAITSVFALYNIEIISLIVVFCLLIALANSDDFCFW